METNTMPPLFPAILFASSLGGFADSFEPSMYPPPWIQTRTGRLVVARPSHTVRGTDTSRSRQSSDSGVPEDGGGPGGLPEVLLHVPAIVWMTRGIDCANQGPEAWGQMRGAEPSSTVLLTVTRGIGGRKRRSPSGASA